ncbi:hypothetical protein [Agarivorans sp.]
MSFASVALLALPLFGLAVPEKSQALIVYKVQIGENTHQLRLT